MKFIMVVITEEGLILVISKHLAVLQFERGEWLEDIREGMGKYVWDCGDIWTGEWKNDKRHGKGKKLWSTGEIDDEEWDQGECILSLRC